MSDLHNQYAFWDDEAATARFSHPLNRAWLKSIAKSTTPILDYGCGYGRTMASLRDVGFRSVTGLDTSQGMLDRAEMMHPGLQLVHSTGVPSPLEDDSFQVVILFAVLTSIPDDDAQRSVIQDIIRLLQPGGHLYVSDLPIQTDARRVARYENARPEGFPYGTFELDGGRATMRHHTKAWFDELFSDFERVSETSITVATMRGQTADAIQFLLRAPRG